MESTTSLVAKQYRLQEWAAQIKECNHRPKGMKVKTWCEEQGITIPNYYYRLRKVREAYLDQCKMDTEATIVPLVSRSSTEEKMDTSTGHCGLELSANGMTLHIKDDTSTDLLSKVLQVMLHVE